MVYEEIVSVEGLGELFNESMTICPAPLGRGDLLMSRRTCGRKGVFKIRGR